MRPAVLVIGVLLWTGVLIAVVGLVTAGNYLSLAIAAIASPLVFLLYRSRAHRG